jgi:hypothetical protein
VPRTGEQTRSHGNFHVMQKLELHFQIDLIRYALLHGILPLEPG